MSGIEFVEAGDEKLISEHEVGVYLSLHIKLVKGCAHPDAWRVLTLQSA